MMSAPPPVPSSLVFLVYALNVVLAFILVKAIARSEVVKVSRDLPGEGSNRRRPSRRRFTAVDRFPGLGSEALSRLPGVRAAEATGLAAACVRLHAGSAVR